MKGDDALGCLVLPTFLFSGYCLVRFVWFIVRSIFGFIWGCIGESVIAVDELLKIFITPLCSIVDTIKIIVYLVFWTLVVMGFFALIGKRSK